MKTFPGSSEQTALPPLSPAEPLAGAVKDKLAALATDDPLPLHRPSRDRVRLLVQSPHRLLLYWNFRLNPFERLHRTFGRRAADFHFGVRLFDLTTGAEKFSLAAADTTGLAGEHWFDARPAAAYKAEVGFLSPAGAFVRVLSSDIARTPRLTVAPAERVAPEFRSSPAEFARVLAETGYERDALLVRFEAAAANLANADRLGTKLPRSLTELFGGSAKTSAHDDPYRDMVLYMFGAGDARDDDDSDDQPDDFVAVLPAELRARLQAALSASNAEELRRLLLAVSNPDDAQDVAEMLTAASTGSFTRTFSSFSLGAHRPPRARRDVWLPSLNHDQLSTLAHRFAAGSFVDD